MSLSLIDPKKHRQLFLDDYAVEKMIGVKQTLHPPKKCGPVLKPNRSIGETGIQSRSAPQWNPEKGVWEWWYFGNHIYYATSTDLEHWDTPSLGLYEWNGSKDNNIANDPEGDQDKRLYHIIRDETDPDPQRRYKGLFSASDRYLGTSPDGFNWTMLDVPPIPGSDESHFTFDEISGQYIAMVKQGTEWGRSVFLATSTDFDHFTDPELVFHTDKIDWENRKTRVREIIENPAYITPATVDDLDYLHTREIDGVTPAESYHMAVMPYEGFYIGFVLIFNVFGANPPPHMNHSRINQIEMTVSRDLRHWERVADREVFIGIEPWDGVRYNTSQVAMAGRPIVGENGEIFIYHMASRIPSGKELYATHNRNKELFRLRVDPEVYNDQSALCLAKLPMDRFACLEAEEAGTIVTKPFMMKGEDLYINAEANWGEIYAEILDAETMKPFPGFWVPAHLPPPLTGDHLRAKIEWQPEHDLVFEKPVRIRFYLYQARLYSFWLE